MNEIEYGQGLYIESAQKFKGLIVLGEHKLFLKASGAEIIQTFVPLEKIVWISLSGCNLRIFVRPGVSFYFAATLQGDRGSIRALADEIIRRRGLKKKFLRKVWVENKH